MRYQSKTVRTAISAVFVTAAVSVFAQSGFEYHRSAIMRGNLVKTVFGNWGVIGQPASEGCRGAWIYDNDGYIGDVSPMVGAEVKSGSKTFHSVVTCPVARPTRQAEQSPSGKAWGFEPEAGYFNESQEGVALYSDPASWPPYWPDKLNDAEDPGWPGSWNGFRGKTTTASEESYFVMDDQNDEEFNYAINNQYGVTFKPDSMDETKNGLGLKVKVRGMQWPDFLAQDVIFWLYEITNTSTTDYAKVVFGMLVGTYVGVTASDDKIAHHEYDDDYSFFDVERDLTYTGDFDDDCSRNPRWIGDVGVVGYAFLESPGNPFDGIDNDGDADANLILPGTGPFFTEEDFAERTILPGESVVIIDSKYNRTVVEMPDTTHTFVTMGDSITIVPGVTVVVEGNVVLQDGQESINPNAYDGIDNDLDGLIDENYYLHFHQIRKDQDGNILIDKFSPVRYKNYITGQGLNDLLIDEKRNDGIDNDGDWNPEFDDIGADGLINTNDYGEGDGQPTAGEPNFDATDVDESDQIGLTSFEYFTPSNDFSFADDEDLWDRLSPGYFEVPESIVNNLPEQGEDGDFIYGSGYFPLPAGETRRFSLALVYGEGGGPNMEIDDLLQNRETVQKIYDSDYNFPPAPDTPTLTVVPGDGKVTLYWDRNAEKSFDPVLKTYDFEGYKIYKATDHNFNDVFKVTDVDGRVISYQPLEQFDLDDGVNGYFESGSDLYQQSHGAGFYLGDDTGLQHSFVDIDVENGKRYFYAVVAYDKGESNLDIFPKENSKRIDILPSGEVRTFQNTAVVTPNAEVAGYEPPENSVLISSGNKIGTGNIYYQVVDEQVQTAHTYRLEFLDTSNDGVDNNGNWVQETDDVGTDGIAGTHDADGTENNGLPDPGEPNLDARDVGEYFVPITTFYSILDTTGVTVAFEAKDTISTRLPHKHIVESSIAIMDEDGNSVSMDKVIVDAENGRIKGKNPGDLNYGSTYTVSYQYYPVYLSPNIQKSPYADETLDTDIFDGIELSFNNNWTIGMDEDASGWSNVYKAMNFTFNTVNTYFDDEQLLGYRHPSDYRIEFADDVIDTSYAMPEYFLTAKPVNFRVYNMTDKKYIKFGFSEIDRNNRLSPDDEIIFVEEWKPGENVFTWDLPFSSLEDTVYTYGAGDTLTIHVTKPFRSGETFEFFTELPEVKLDLTRSQLDSMLNAIKVVPNPYIVATTHELPLPPAITSGRGERKIDFIHLPSEATIHIFTVRGERVATLNHLSDIHDGTVSWNLKSHENLDVAAGVYFYVIETPIGTKRGKIGIIK